MFGKIKLALGGQGQSNQNLQKKEVQNNQNQKTQTSGKKSFLSNPCFVSKSKHEEKNIKKQSKRDEESSEVHKGIQKTKQIRKQQPNFQSTKPNNQKPKPTASIQSQMQGSKFRILNELLYTTTSQQAMNHFKQNPEDYVTYHAGYRSQSQKWQSKPVNVIIKYFRKNFKEYKSKKICDLGCGQGFLYEGLTKKKYEKKDDHGNTTQVNNKHVFEGKNIFSYDLVSLKPFIQIADISNLPLQDGSMDVAVFCLSLMGKNYLEFIKQASRVLKAETGQLIIAEVQSRSKNWKAFAEMIQLVGFKLVNNGVNLEVKGQTSTDKSNSKRVAENQGKYFRVLQFVKCKEEDIFVKKIRVNDKTFGKQSLVELSQILLTQCIYKKR